MRRDQLPPRGGMQVIMRECHHRWMALPPAAERIHMGCPVMDARSLRGGRPVIRHVPVQAMRDDVLVDRCVFFEVTGVITGHDGAIRHDDAARVSAVVVPTCKGAHQRAPLPRPGSWMRSTGPGRLVSSAWGLWRLMKVIDLEKSGIPTARTDSRVGQFPEFDMGV